MSVQEDMLLERAVSVAVKAVRLDNGGDFVGAKTQYESALVLFRKLLSERESASTMHDKKILLDRLSEYEQRLAFVNKKVLINHSNTLMTLSTQSDDSIDTKRLDAALVQTMQILQTEIVALQQKQQDLAVRMNNFQNDLANDKKKEHAQEPKQSSSQVQDKNNAKIAQAKSLSSANVYIVPTGALCFAVLALNISTLGFKRLLEALLTEVSLDMIYEFLEN